MGKYKYYRTLRRARERGSRERVCVRVGVCEGGSGLLGGVEMVRSESWRVEQRDRIEHLASG